MQLAPTATFAAATPTAPKPSAVIEDALTNLEWAHEAIGSATSDPEYVEEDVLGGAVGDAQRAATMLGTIDPSKTPLDVVAAAKFATAVAAEMGAAQVLLNQAPGTPETIAGIERHGEAAEVAIHKAFQALGTDRD